MVSNIRPFRYDKPQITQGGPKSAALNLKTCHLDRSPTDEGVRVDWKYPRIVPCPRLLKAFITLTLKLPGRNSLHAHIRPQRLRHHDAAVGLLVILQNRQPSAPNGQSAAVQGMHEFASSCLPPDANGYWPAAPETTRSSSRKKFREKASAPAATLPGRRSWRSLTPMSPVHSSITDKAVQLLQHRLSVG